MLKALMKVDAVVQQTNVTEEFHLVTDVEAQVLRNAQVSRRFRAQLILLTGAIPSKIQKELQQFLH
jgi:hypothetical protein